MDMTINLETVELGSTKNHLLFKGHVPTLNNFYMYKFDFTGITLTSTSGLTNEQLERLRIKLLEDYGYAPFDENKAIAILGTGNQYRIEM